MTDTQKRKRTEAADGTSKTWTDEEKDAMKERAKELKTEARRSASASAKKAEGEQDLLAKIAEMPESDRVMAERVHAVVTASAPELTSKTWYGMPAYAKDGKVVCFFKSAAKFNSRYATLGFEEEARIDDGVMWPTSFGLTEVTPAVEKRIAELVKKAVS
jgi:uncharacterized protein YdhG (YjbR/CyaY superfamily)